MGELADVTGEAPFADWVDINVHYGPDVVPRSQTAQAAVDAARELGLAAICLRSHAGSSVDLAQALDNSTSSGPRVVGGITLNSPVGGLNPHAVDVALQTGGRVVALPTWDAEAETASPRKTSRSIALFEGGSPAPGLGEILDLVAAAHSCIDLGPARADQLLPLVRLARASGVERVVVSHPFYPAQRYPLDLVAAAVDEGAMIEHCYMQFDPNYPNHPNVDELIAQIHAVGPAAVVLSSDSGKSGFPQLAGCLTNFRAMLADEFSPQDLRTMFAVNPGWLMGLAI